MAKLFEYGEVVATAAVAEFLSEADIVALLKRHISGDWGNVHPDDDGLNDDAVKNGGRVHSVYEVGNKTIWVITEWDRSVTTFLYPSEY